MLKTYFKYKMGNYVKHAAKIGRKRAKTITFCGFENKIACMRHGV